MSFTMRFILFALFAWGGRAALDDVVPETEFTTPSSVKASERPETTLVTTRWPWTVGCSFGDCGACGNTNGGFYW